MTAVVQVSPARGEELKREGQDAAARRATPAQEDAFMAAIRALAPGSRFSANTCRAAWDRAGVPEVARAGLMKRACALGLAEKVVIRLSDGRTIPDQEPSTGASAHRAFVYVYRRPAANREGR